MKTKIITDLCKSFVGFQKDAIDTVEKNNLTFKDSLTAKEIIILLFTCYDAMITYMSEHRDKLKTDDDQRELYKRTLSAFIEDACNIPAGSTYEVKEEV